MIGIIIAAVFGISMVSAQEMHYNTFQVGSRSAFMGGAVLGSSRHRPCRTARAPARQRGLQPGGTQWRTVWTGTAAGAPMGAYQALYPVS